MKPIRALLPLLALLVTLPARGAELKTRHVIFATTDGFRWQELFRGSEERPPYSRAFSARIVVPPYLKQERR